MGNFRFLLPWTVVLPVVCVLVACGTSHSPNGPPPPSPPPPPTFTLLYEFTGGADGAGPNSATMVLDAQGNLYGTTHLGGDINCNASLHSGCGTVWQLDTARNLTVLHSFTGGPLDNGATGAGLVLDGNGNLYGGAADQQGSGLVYALAKNGPLEVLYYFASGGEWPTGNLLRDTAGNLYGTTLGGGGSNDPDCPNNLGCGTVFELGPTGQLTELYSFLNNTDGSGPYSVIPDGAGNLLGVTYHGGGQGCAGVLGCGILFKLDASGKKTVLYAFTGGNDGSTPSGSLVRDAAGNLYGTAQAGGDLACPYNGGDGCGVVFKLDTVGVLTVLHAFHGGADGNVPVSVILDAAGNLYGITQSGPYTGICGTVFKLDALGNLTNLHNFAGPEGCSPVGELVQDAAGNLYGTTSGGRLAGTVFEIKP
jgi:uncharacterized repeat protein (TIGR03803 family)